MQLTHKELNALSDRELAQGVNFFMVDDNPHVLNEMTAYLTAHFCDPSAIHTASSLAGGYKIFGLGEKSGHTGATVDPDKALLICDYYLGEGYGRKPELGTELISAIRASQALQSLPLFLRTDSPDLVRQRSHQGTAVISKGANPIILHTKIRNLLIAQYCRRHGIDLSPNITQHSMVIAPFQQKLLDNSQSWSKTLEEVTASCSNEKLFKRLCKDLRQHSDYANISTDPKTLKKGMLSIIKEVWLYLAEDNCHRAQHHDWLHQQTMNYLAAQKIDVYPDDDSLNIQLRRIENGMAPKPRLTSPTISGFEEIKRISPALYSDKYSSPEPYIMDGASYVRRLQQKENIQPPDKAR